MVNDTDFVRMSDLEAKNGPIKESFGLISASSKSRLKDSLKIVKFPHFVSLFPKILLYLCCLYFIRFYRPLRFLGESSLRKKLQISTSVANLADQI